MIGKMAIATALLGFNDVGPSVTSIFLLMDHFLYQFPLRWAKKWRKSIHLITLFNLSQNITARVLYSTLDFHINTYSTTTTTQGKADITMDRYGGTQQRYLISGPLYCVLYNSWKWLECTVWHVFLWRISLWIENEPITDRNDSINTPWLGANLVLRASHLPAQPLPLWYKRKMRHPGN